MLEYNYTLESESYHQLNIIKNKKQVDTINERQ